MINIAFSSGCVEDGRWAKAAPEEMVAQVISCRPAFSDASAAHAIATAYHMCVQFLGYFIRYSHHFRCHWGGGGKKVVENVEKIPDEYVSITPQSGKMCVIYTNHARMDGLVISNPYTKCHQHKQKDGQYHY
jgi:hypothetical protein